MLGLGKSNAAIEAFAQTLVTDLAKRFPPERQRELGGTKLKPAQQFGKAVKDLERKVTDFQQEHDLGIYGKAKLLNAIKWQLKDLGYADDFVEVTITALAQLVGTRK
jgi:hypothetical protein